MISFLISILLFIITVPLRSIKFIISANIKALQSGERLIGRKGGRGGAGGGIVGKTAQLGGKAVKGAGKAISATGKGVHAGGTVVKGGTKVGGKATNLAGKGTHAAGEAVSAIPYVGTVLGGGMKILGKTAEKTGTVVEKGGHYAGTGIQKTGDVVKGAGNLTQSAGQALQNAGSGGAGVNPRQILTLPLKAAIIALKLLRRGLNALIVFISSLSKVFTVIGAFVILILITIFVFIIAMLGMLQSTILGGNIDINKLANHNTQVQHAGADTRNYVEPDIKGWLQCCDDTWWGLKKAGCYYCADPNVKQPTPFGGNARIDCSGYVFLCLVNWGTFKKVPKGQNYSQWCSGTMWEYAGKLKGWKFIKVENTVEKAKKQLKKGDIVFAPGDHAQVYAGGTAFYTIGTIENENTPKSNDSESYYTNFCQRMIDTHGGIIRMRGYYTGNSTGASISQKVGEQLKDLIYPNPKDGGVSLNVPIYYQSSSGFAESNHDSRFYDACTGELLTTFKIDGYNDMGGTGCGIVSMSMIMTYLTGKVISPVKLVKTLRKDGLGKYYSGALLQSNLHNIPELFKVKVTFKHDMHPTLKLIKQRIDAGYVGIALMRNGVNHLWTGHGHYIVIRGYTDKGVYVNDPNGPGNYSKHGHAGGTLNGHVNRSHPWSTEFVTSTWEGNRERWGIGWFKVKGGGEQQ